jgi:hypothetical protein
MKAALEKAREKEKEYMEIIKSYEQGPGKFARESMR